MRKKSVIVYLIAGIFCLLWMMVGYFHHDQSSEIVWLAAAVVWFVAIGIRYMIDKRK